MKKFTADLALSRRSAIKGAATVAAGAAAPALLRIHSAYAAYPDRPVKIVVANTPGASTPDEERSTRKRRLLKGPKEFRDIRGDLPKPKS
jgi:hypothetical protein